MDLFIITVQQNLGIHRCKVYPAYPAVIKVINLIIKIFAGVGNIIGRAALIYNHRTLGAVQPHSVNRIIVGLVHIINIFSEKDGESEITFYIGPGCKA